MTFAQNEYQRWLNFADRETAKELEKLRGNREQIEYLFGQRLAFGTAGLRGVMTPGLYAMNDYTVAAATAGLARYIKDLGAEKRGVIIGTDSRLHSADFAKTTACVLAAQGVKVYLFDELRPTPMVSYATRAFHCIAGVNITASHNPKEYNGYKVYFEDGAQITLDQARIISGYIDNTDVFGVERADFDSAVADGRIALIGKDFDEDYLAKVLEQQVDPAAVKKAADSFRIVYSPFHGAGYRLVPEALRRIGVKNLFIVPEQAQPDGNFPTVVSPNPENPEGFALGISLAEKVGADLVLATDPDCDRVGVMARGSDGAFVCITGNQMGALLLEYILSAHTANGTMPPAPYAVKTIVTTDLASEICKAYGVRLFDVLTGFKYIGEVIKNQLARGNSSFILGYEESYGYLKGSYARDKDGVVASVLITEMAAHYATLGKTLIDARDDLFEKYGFFAEKTISLNFTGVKAQENMRSMMEKLRADPPVSIGGSKVRRSGDYLEGFFTCKVTGNRKKTGLPSSNVLSFSLFNRCKVLVRPSGTEPKVKVYLLCRGKTESEALARLDACKQDMEKLV